MVTMCFISIFCARWGDGRPTLDRFIGREAHAFSIKLSLYNFVYVQNPPLLYKPTRPPSLHTHIKYSKAWELNRALAGVVDPTLSLSLSLRSLVKFVFECVLYRHGEILYYYYYIPVYIIKENVIVDDERERMNLLRERENGRRVFVFCMEYA